MKLTIPQPILADALARGGAAVAKSSVAPILGCVRLIASFSTGILHLASTDGDRFAEIGVSAEVEEGGSACVDAQALTALVNRYPKDGVVTLELESPTLLRVKCGRSRVGLPALNASDFPDWTPPSDPAVFTIAGPALADAFSRLRPIVSAASSINWQSVFIEPADGALNACAFNGHVMMLLKLALPDGAEGAPAMILHTGAVDTFARLFKTEPEVLVRATAQKISFEAGGVRFVSKLVEGRMPPYPMLHAVRSERRARVDREEFTSCLVRATLAAEREGALNVVTITPNEDGIELRARNHQGGDATEPMGAEVSEGFGPASFAPAYLTAILSGMSGEFIVFEEAVRDQRYLVYAEGDETLTAGVAPIRSGGRP